MSIQQVNELRAIEPYSHEFGFRAFARKHSLKVGHVYYMRKKLGLPVIFVRRHHEQGRQKCAAKTLVC